MSPGDEIATLERRLRESETRGRLLTESWAQAVWETDAHGVTVADSPSWRAYTGQTLAEWLGYGWLDAIHPDDRAYAERQWREAVAARRPVDAEFRLRAAKGGWRWTNVRAAPVLDTDGDVEKWVGLNIDIDARKRAEDALRASEDKYRTLFESIDEGFCVVEMLYDEDGVARDCRYLQVNPAFLRQTGQADPTGMLGSDYAPAASPAWLATYDAVVRSGEPVRFEQFHADSGRWYSIYASVIGARGSRLVASVFADITERRRVEAASRENEERQAFLLKLSDALRPLRDTGQIQQAAMTLLGEQLAVNRAAYYQVAADEITFFVTARWERGAPPPLPERMLITDFGEDMRAAYRAGRTIVARDTEQDIASDDIQEAVRPLQVRGWIGVPLVKEGRWFASIGVHSLTPRDWSPADIRLVEDVAERTWDAIERGRAEAALRENEERQRFLLKFSDTLRAEPSMEATAYRAVALLLEELRLDRCYITYYRPDEDLAEFPYQVGNATVPPLPATVRLSDFPDAYEQVLDRTFVVEDDFERRGLSAAERANSAALGMRAMVASTIRKGDKHPLASMVAVSSTPRTWTGGEIALVEEVAERTWSAIEHARAETALRESEERFQQFAAASAAGLWIRDAESLSMEFTSAAIGTIYGVGPDALLGDVKRWAATILPEDRDRALGHLEAARRGRTVAHEFRIQRPSDGAFRWIRNTDFPLRDNGHIPRIGGIAEDITEAKLAIEHQAVLLGELQHRVRNIMTIIRSTARRSADGAADVDDYRALLEGRLLALARVQALLTRQANTGGALRDIVESEVGAQAGGGQFVLVGPDVQLSPKAAEVLTLAFHELATNALKYGALSVPEGRLRVEWAPFAKRGRTWLAIDWAETGAPSRKPVTRRGFGSDLIEGKIPYELGGTGRITIGPGGARCRLEFPLQEGESILETDAPSPTTVFGGTLDMTGAPDLTGRSVLVVEDDYYIAGDTTAALRGAGATVLGPCPTEEATFDLLGTAAPTHAVLDLNLGGGGPRFEIAKALKARGVPFIFLTGYDPDAIPADLADVVRLQKPVPFRAIVEAVGKL